MNETQKTFVVHAGADDSRIWYPLHPRWIPLLRLFGVLSLLFAIYTLVLQRPWSLSSLSRWCVPAILVFVASNRKPSGMGEPGTPPIAPAVANALLSLTGKATSSLPFVT